MMPSRTRYEAVNSNANREDDADACESHNILLTQFERDEIVRPGSVSSVFEIDTTPRDAPATVDPPPGFRALKLLDNLPDAKSRPEWRDPVRWCLWGNLAVLVINVVFMIAAVGVSASKNPSLGFGSIKLYQGSCTKTRNIKIGLHLLVNVLSVAMTATSSYCCAILMAPSRSDIDKAHSTGTWLSVGISSWRNFRIMKRSSQVSWSLLLLTSLVIQMIYNSAVYSSLNSNTYPALVAPEDFVQKNSSFTTSYYEEQSCWPEDVINWNITVLRTAILNGSFEYLDKTDCFEKYATSFVSDRRTVVMVTQDDMTGDGISLAGYGYPGGIAALNPAKKTVDNVTDLLFYLHANAFYFSPVGFDWMCYMNESYGPSCSSAFIEGLNPWKVSALGWARQTTTKIPSITDSFNRDGLLRKTKSGWEQYLQGFRNMIWTTEEIDDFLSEVQSNPLPDRMWAYLNKTNWISAVEPGMNVSSTCPTLRDQYYFLEELPQHSVNYCFSQTVPEECGVFYHLPIAIAVIICSLVKMGCIWLLLETDRRDLFLTLGDAISSFLQQPDQTTKSWCTLSAKAAAEGEISPWRTKKKKSPGAHLWSHEPQPGRLPPARRRWRAASNTGIWLLTWLVLVLYIVMSLWIPEAAVQNLSTHAYKSEHPMKAIWQIKGWGEVQSTALLSTLATSFVGMALLSNTPQLAVSLLYFCLNDTMTRCIFAGEFSEFEVHRRPLRVSFPRGEQKSTWYLTIPYQYAVPLLASFTLAHWFISEGLFYVQILPYDLQGNPVPSESLITCGVSTIPLELALFLIIAVCLSVLILGRKALKSSRMPLALECSVAISAACHPPRFDLDAAFKPVQWGVVEDNSDAPYRHCSFTSKKVKEPEPFVEYA